MAEFDSIEFLKTGNRKQVLAYHLLSENGILENLKKFDPILVGTIPIRVDIDGSDLDIICYWTEKSAFIESLNCYFGQYAGFVLREVEMHDAIIACFQVADFEIEIFGQNIPTRQQNAYKHMIIEHLVLEKFGEKFREEVIALKKQGFKTEPAFAKLLGLRGDPYEALLRYETEPLSS